MRSHLEFVSREFPAEPDEEELVNPDRYGKRLAEFLSIYLPQHGFQVQAMYPEDWGWRIDLENSEFPLWVGCGNYDWIGSENYGEEGQENGFLCFIEPSKSSIRRWFIKVDTRTTVERLAAAVQKILEESGRVEQLRWWSEEEVGLSH